MDFLQNHIEALIFCSHIPTKVADLQSCLSEMFNADVPEQDIIDAIGRLDGAQAVGDDDGGAPLHQPVERLLHQRLRLVVQRACGLRCQVPTPLQGASTKTPSNFVLVGNVAPPFHKAER